MSSAPPPIFVPVGTNGARLFGMDARTRACRLAMETAHPRFARVVLVGGRWMTVAVTINSGYE